jgi:hypothetical protein
VAERVSRRIERITVRVANVLARGLHKLGLHGLADVISDEPARR